MTNMVLEKQDSGISLSMGDAPDAKTNDLDLKLRRDLELSATASAEQLNNLDSGPECTHRTLSETNLLEAAHFDEHAHHVHDLRTSVFSVNDTSYYGIDPDDDVHVPLHRTVCCALCRKKQARIQKAAGTPGSSPVPIQSSQESIPDNTSVTSSRAGGRPWIKDPLQDATPVTDPVLRQRIQSVTDKSPGSGVRLRERKPSIDGTKTRSMPVMKTSDQKILQLMITKKEEERRRELERDQARSKWETERKKEFERKKEAERKQEALTRSATNKRRSHSSGDRKSFSPAPNHSHHNGTPEPCSCGRNHDRNVEIPCRKHLATPRRHQSTSDLDQASEPCRRNWVVASQKRQEMQAKQLQEKKMREEERKRSVEKRLEEQRKEQEEQNNKLREKQEAALQRAESLRLSKEQQRELRLKLKNFQQRQRHEARQSEMKRQSMEDLAAMKASIDLKDHLALRNKKDLEGSHKKETKRRSLDLDNRLQLYRDNKTKMDSDVQNWHEDLLRYRQMKEDQAEKQAKENQQQKARRLNEQLRNKQQAQKENMKRLLSAEEEWKAGVEATIAQKDAKSRMIKQEKEELIQQSRSMAHTTQRLREEFRQHYSMNDLDKLNRQAEFESRFTARPLRPNTGAL